MSEGSKDQTTAENVAGIGARVANGAIAAAALAGVGLMGKWGYAQLEAGGAAGQVREHALAVIGLPILATVAIAIVCGARALDARFDLEVLGLRARGSMVLVLSWTLVFSALVIALRALW